MANENLQKTILLPYGTTSDNITKLLDSIKNKEGDEKGIRAIYSGSKIEATQSSLEALGIVSNYKLSEIGKQIVFESDERKKQNAFLSAVLNFPPYEYFISYLMQRKELTETEIETVKNFWGRNNYGTPNNRIEGATVCFTFFHLAGLGDYVVGRKGKSTRFVWNSDAEEILNKFNNPQEITNYSVQEEIKYNDENNENNYVDNPQDAFIQKKDLQVNHSIPTSIEIKVDMTEWEIERIRDFFSILNGNNT